MIRTSCAITDCPSAFLVSLQFAVCHVCLSCLPVLSQLEACETPHSSDAGWLEKRLEKAPSASWESWGGVNGGA